MPKYQYFKALDLNVQVQENCFFHDHGYKRDMRKWANQIIDKKERQGYPNVESTQKGRKLVNALERLWGYRCLIRTPWEGPEYPFREEENIAYVRGKNSHEDLLIRAHEETHAADCMIITPLGLLPIIKNYICINPKLEKQAVFMGLGNELIADIGGLFPLIRLGMTPEKAIGVLHDLTNIPKNCQRIKQLKWALL